MSRGNVTCWRTLLLNFTVKDCQERDCGEGKTRGDVGKQIHGRTFHTRQHNTNNTRSHTRSTDIGGSARRDDTPKRKSSLKQGVGHKKARFRSALAETWHENVKLGALTVGIPSLGAFTCAQFVSAETQSWVPHEGRAEQTVPSVRVY